MQINSSTEPSDRVELAAVMVEVGHDLVQLRRRVREIGLESGLDARGVRSLSTATFEAGRALFARAGRVRAEVHLVEGPALHVTLRGPILEPASREWIAAQMRPLRSFVDGLAINEQGDELSITIHAVLLDAGTREHTVARPLAASDGLPAGTEGSGERLLALQRAIEDLQNELQETNRGVVALYSELSDQTERVRDAEDRFRLLLDSVQDYAICMLDTSGVVTSWNSGGERVFGYPLDDIIGHGLERFYTAAECDAGGPAQHLATALADGRFECEGVRVRRGGGTFDALVLITPVRDGFGLVRGFSLVVRDITERKQLENNLRQRAEDLAAANRAKEDFLATLSHELRTPLNAMMGWTRLVRTGKLDPSAMARALETIERNAHVQAQLIADILDLSRIVTGRLRADLRPIGLAPVIDAAVDAVRPTAGAKGVQLSCDVRFGGTVMGDPDRLQQVVWNLLVNAIKFTPQGGRVSLSLARMGSSAVITVSDTGEGIPGELLPFVFDRFTQGDPSVTRQHGGLGLGLSIVRHIVELHGGQVQALSGGAGLGATFVVSLPIRAVQHAAEHAAADSMLNGLKVLVVDDDPDAREVVSTALAQCGASTVAAGSTREALQVLQEFKPDVLVSDISMPGEDGYALIRRVRTVAPRGVRDVPAIALTGFTQSEDRRRALMAGFQQFIPKPVEADVLAEAIRGLAERRTR